MFSPTFRSVVRVEDLPPETVGQAKEIFEYLAKTQGVNNAAQYLLEQFGQVKQKQKHSRNIPVVDHQTKALALTLESNKSRFWINTAVLASIKA
jgi:hypothetical protein